MTQLLALWEICCYNAGKSFACSGMVDNKTDMINKGVLFCIMLFTSLCSDAQTKKRNASNAFTDETAVAIASNKYYPASLFRKVLIGTNYRETWNTQVELPVFLLSKSGLKIHKLGGGQQTKSLRLEDKNGDEWVLRTVDKDVKGALPEKFHGTIIEKVTQDAISALHPYAPLVVSNLAKTAGIIAPQPKIVFVAADPAIGEHNSLFANTVCLLEKREPTPDNSDTKSTETVLEKIADESDHLIIQKDVLNARLLDMLIGDWDRHADQWRWGVIDSIDNKYYYPIPRDRDNAFFSSNGLLVRFARLLIMRELSGFKEKSTGLKNLNHKTHLFDKTFMNDLDADDWKQITSSFIDKMSDKNLEEAVKKLPPEVYALDGDQFIKKLKSRREGLLQNVMKYYRILSASVTINGSNDDEEFVAINDNGNVNIKMYKVKNKKQLIYNRTFNPSETVFVYINGKNGNDRFITAKDLNSKIKLRIDGGGGRDIYDLNGELNIRVVDQKAEHNQFLNTCSAQLRLK